MLEIGIVARKVKSPDYSGPLTACNQPRLQAYTIGLERNTGSTMIFNESPNSSNQILSLEYHSPVFAGFIATKNKEKKNVFTRSSSAIR